MSQLRRGGGLGGDMRGECALRGHERGAADWTAGDEAILPHIKSLGSIY